MWFFYGVVVYVFKVSKRIFLVCYYIIIGVIVYYIFIFCFDIRDGVV